MNFHTLLPPNIHSYHQVTFFYKIKSPVGGLEPHIVTQREPPEPIRR
nr:MAG TPA: hypothetical protein [Caudoviricetes sp.]